MSKLPNSKSLVMIAAVGVMCGMANTATAASSCTLTGVKRCSTAAIKSGDKRISVRATVEVPNAFDYGTVMIREHDANGKLTNRVVFKERNFRGTFDRTVQVPTAGLYSCLVESNVVKKDSTVSCTIN